MNTEQLIAKGVEKHFNGQQVLFKVESLNEHFSGLQIHESDILKIEEVDFVKADDVDFTNAVPNIVEPKQEEEVEKPVAPGMSYEEAEELAKIGGFIALPEWEGFWFANIKNGEVLVLTKDGEITNTPHEEYKERKDWITVIPTEAQMQLVNDYLDALDNPEPVQDTPVNQINVVTTEEDTPVATLEEKPAVEETFTENQVLQTESDSVQETETNNTEAAQEPVSEAPAPKTKKAAK